MVYIFEKFKNFFVDRRKTRADRRQFSRDVDRRDIHRSQFKNAEEWYLSASVEIKEISTDQAITDISTTDTTPEKIIEAKQKTVDWVIKHSPKDKSTKLSDEDAQNEE